MDQKYLPHCIINWMLILCRTYMEEMGSLAFNTQNSCSATDSSMLFSYNMLFLGRG